MLTFRDPGALDHDNTRMPRPSAHFPEYQPAIQVSGPQSSDFAKPVSKLKAGMVLNVPHGIISHEFEPPISLLIIPKLLIGAEIPCNLRIEGFNMEVRSILGRGEDHDEMNSLHCKCRYGVSDDGRPKRWRSN